MKTISYLIKIFIFIAISPSMLISDEFNIEGILNSSTKEQKKMEYILFEFQNDSEQTFDEAKTEFFLKYEYNPKHKVANNKCFCIKDKDSRFGCLAGEDLYRGNIGSANSKCHAIVDNDAKRGCLSGVELAKDNLDQALNWCHSMNNEDAKMACLSGVELAKGDFNRAIGWCHRMKNEDGKKACLSGIELAKGNSNKALNWCHCIVNEDARWDCFSSVDLFKITTITDENEVNIDYEQSFQLENELVKLEQEFLDLNSQLKEQLGEIKTIVSEYPELLNDPEIQEILGLR